MRRRVLSPILRASSHARVTYPLAMPVDSSSAVHLPIPRVAKATIPEEKKQSFATRRWQQTMRPIGIPSSTALCYQSLTLSSPIPIAFPQLPVTFHRSFSETAGSDKTSFLSHPVVSVASESKQPLEIKEGAALSGTTSPDPKPGSPKSLPTSMVSLSKPDRKDDKPWQAGDFIFWLGFLPLSVAFCLLLYSMVSSSRAREEILQLLIDGDEKSALALFIKYIENIPEIRSTIVFLQQGKIKEAKPILDAYFRRHSHTSENYCYYVLMGVLLASAGNGPEAIASCTEAIRVTPTRDIAYFVKAKILCHQNKFEEAIACCNAFIEVNPKYARAYVVKAKILFMQKKYKEALHACDQALDFEVENKANILIFKASILFEKGNYKAVRNICDQALALNPNNIKALSFKSKVLLYQNFRSKAIAVCDQILAIDPKNTEAFICKGLALVGLEKYDEAIQNYEQAIKAKVENRALIEQHKAAIIAEEKNHRSLLNERDREETHGRADLLEKLEINNLPTHYECAQLSLAVYNKKGEHKLPLDKWELVALSTDRRFGGAFSKEGYFGAAYQHKKTKQIIIAHRGTECSDPGSLGAALDIVAGKIPKQQFKIAHEFTKRIQEEHKEEKEEAEITHTGHSLGGVLAQLCAYEHEMPAVTFDSPGCKELIKGRLGQDIDPQEINIISYLSTPNPINTYLTHVGLRLRVFPHTFVIETPDRYITYKSLRVLSWITRGPLSSVFQASAEVVSSSAVTPYWETPTRHSMERIAEHFDPHNGRPRTRVLITGWPRSDLLSNFDMFCTENQEQNRDPRKKKLDRNLHFRLEQTGYEAYDFKDDHGQETIPLSQFSPDVRWFLKNYPLGKVTISPSHLLDPAILRGYKIENRGGQEMVVITNKDLLAEDFRTYLTYNFQAAKRKKEKICWEKSSWSFLGRKSELVSPTTTTAPSSVSSLRK